jgi:hypothetical protein
MGNRAESLYESQVRNLSESDRLRLVELITHDLVEARTSEQGKRSILELRGLGAEIWKGVDAQDYVDELRDEWGDRR